MSSTEAPPGIRQKSGPPTERVKVEAPAFERVSHARLTDLASALAKKPVSPAPKALMELSARHPYDATYGNIDVFEPGRWDTTSNLIFMDSVRTVGPLVGEWEGSAAYLYFNPPAEGTYLIVGHFTGYQCTMYLGGPWGQNSAYTAETSDSGAVVALYTGSQHFEFGMGCEAPDNGSTMGYIESVQVFQLN
jgi:hypothetical protein